MMRPQSLVLPPVAPSIVSVTQVGNDAVNVSWNDASLSETAFVIQGLNTAGTWVDLPDGTFPAPLNQQNTLSVVSKQVGLNPALTQYRVVAQNTVGYGGEFMGLAAQSVSEAVPFSVSAPIAVLDPTSLDFGSLAVGTTSQPQTVTLSNTGNAVLNITAGPAVTGADAASYALATTCGATVAAGASCTMTVTFTPREVQTETATLSIQTNYAVNGGLLTVPLTGTGLAVPIAGVTPASLNFGNQPVGTTTAVPLLATLSNAATATGPLSITSVTPPANFARATTVANNCGTTLAVGATCAIGVTFAPTAAVAYSGNLSIATNDPVNPTLTVALSGTGSAVVAGPAAPTNVSIVRTNATRATFAWTDASTNETSFQRQVSTNGGGTWTNLGGVITRTAAQATATGQTLTRTVTVNANTNALYRVLATNASGSTPSASVGLNNTVAPAAPSGVAVGCVRNGGTDRCTVTWTDNANNNTGFRIQRATNAGFTTGLVTTTVGANATTFSVANLARNTNLYFRVLAYNNDPQTPTSAYVNAAPSPVRTP